MARSVGCRREPPWMAAVTSLASGRDGAARPDDPVSPCVAITTGVPRRYAASRAAASVAAPVQRSNSGAAGTYRSTRARSRSAIGLPPSSDTGVSDTAPPEARGRPRTRRDRHGSRQRPVPAPRPAGVTSIAGVRVAIRHEGPRPDAGARRDRPTSARSSLRRSLRCVTSTPDRASPSRIERTGIVAPDRTHE